MDTLRSPAVEPKRMNRMLAIAMLVGVAVATVGRRLRARPRGSRKEQYPVGRRERPRRRQPATTAGSSRTSATPTGSSSSIRSSPGRIAYDSRFELLTSRQLRSVTEFRNRVNGWRSTIGGYSVLVLDKVDDHQPIRALLRAREARVVARRGPVVVLQRR